MRELARLLLPSIRWDPGHGMAAARRGAERALDAGVGGFVFDRVPPDVAAELTALIRDRADEAPLLVIDPASLGDRARPAGSLSLPPPAALASLRDTLVVRRVARTAAHAVRRSGCNAMLAPSCDVAVAPRTDTFGGDASAVAVAAAEWIDAAQADGVLCCAGNFPGAGRVVDDERALPIVTAPEDALYATDLVPFRAAIDAGVAGIAMAAAAYPALDARGTPAALSSNAIARILRGELGYDGLVVTDSLRLDARVGHAVLASDLVAAGVDLVLRTTRLDVELRALLDALEGGRLDRERVHRAAWRRRERAELAGAPDATAVVADADHAWLDDLAERTIAVVRGRAVRIVAPMEVVVVVGDRRADPASVVASFAEGVADAGGDRDGVRHVMTPSSAVRSALVVLVVPSAQVGADDAASARAPDQLASVCAVARRSRRDIAVIWCGHPGVARASLDADLVIACWTASSGMLRAAGRWVMRRV